MAVFISHARQDKDAVELLRRDIESAQRQVWIDGRLTGGQAWWATILEQIRGTELFVFALSSSSLRSNPCMAELRYALALGRPVLPVRVRSIDPRLAPPEIANAQIVDYTSRTPESAIALFNALNAWPPPGPDLPAELPPPPPVPIEYLNTLREQVEAESLTFTQQSALLTSLKSRMDDEDDGVLVRNLIASLRRRPDVAESIARDIDALRAGQQQARAGVGGPTAAGAGAATGPDGPSPAGGSPWAAPPRAGGWQHAPGPPPTGGPPLGGAGGQAPPLQSWPRPASSPAWDGGTLVALLALSLFVPLAGWIIGGINLKHDLRRGQSWGLIIVGIVGFLFYLSLSADAGSGY